MLLPNVIDVDGYSATLPTKPGLMRPALCLAGTMSPGSPTEDGARWLLDTVMPALWAKHPDLRLYIVGRDVGPELLRRANDRVVVTGSVPSIVPYLRQADVAVVPVRFESGTRFKILEALACRTPVVSTTLGAEGLELEQERHLLIADDPGDFADKIGRLLDDEMLRKHVIDQGYTLVLREYSLTAGERYLTSILSALDARS
jgi:glycosyltransferase involved in cell wall biosynthesis